jgi:hypothetical protein
MQEHANREPSRGLIVWLAAALAAWGLYLAVGAFLFNHDVRRGLLVFGCMAAFLGWWLLLLRGRGKRSVPCPRLRVHAGKTADSQPPPTDADQRFVQNGQEA